jgi:hypothetical protein
VGEFADEGVAFGDGAGGPFEVVAGGGVVNVLVELGQPGLVGGAGPVIEDGISPAGAIRAASCVARTGSRGWVRRVAMSRRPLESGMRMVVP